MAVPLLLHLLVSELVLFDALLGQYTAWAKFGVCFQLDMRSLEACLRLAEILIRHFKLIVLQQYLV